MEYNEIISKLPKFFIDMIESQYGNDVKNIIQGFCCKRKTTFRINTLKSNVEEVEEELKKYNIEFMKAKVSEVAYIIPNANEIKLQELNIYKDGKIYMQSLSSMLPPIILNPMPDKDILDMAAAPRRKDNTDGRFIK